MTGTASPGRRSTVVFALRTCVPAVSEIGPSTGRPSTMPRIVRLSGVSRRTVVKLSTVTDAGRRGGEL
jgi:hypothetical protein